MKHSNSLNKEQLIGYYNNDVYLVDIEEQKICKIDKNHNIQFYDVDNRNNLIEK